MDTDPGVVCEECLDTFASGKSCIKKRQWSGLESQFQQRFDNIDPLEFLMCRIPIDSIRSRTRAPNDLNVSKTLLQGLIATYQVGACRKSLAQLASTLQTIGVSYLGCHIDIKSLTESSVQDLFHDTIVPERRLVGRSVDPSFD